MANMLKIQYGEGGAYPPSWIDLKHVYSVQLECVSNHPSQLIVECGATGGTPPPLLSCIRAIDLDYGGGAGVFSGRIDEVKPIYNTRMGHVWQIRARDYLAALADNTVGHPMNNGCAGCMPVDGQGRYVPNWRYGIPGVNWGCLEGQNPSSAAYGCGRPRYYVVIALALSPRHAFGGHTPIDIATGADYIAPDYLHCPTKTVLQAIQELCDAGTWQETTWPYRIRHGWDFRQSLWQWPSYFVVLPRGKPWWDQNISWAWKEHGSNRVTITDYKVFDHGYDVYTRAYAMGTGDISGLEAMSTENFGMITPGVNDPDGQSYNKENIWNPASGYFRVQRDASEVRIGTTDKQLLTDAAQAKLQADGYDFYYRGRKMQLTTVGIPRAYGGLPPIPGYKIYVQGIPGIEPQAFVINRWSYKAPEGITTVDLGLPLNEQGLKMVAVQNLAHQGISGQHWVGPWWSTMNENAGGADYLFYHNLGVMPRNVYVQIAKINTVGSGCDNPGHEVSAECLYKPSISAAERMHREEDGRWVGYATMSANKDAVLLRWAHFMGYSWGEAMGAHDPTRGWLELGWDTAFRIVVEA